MAELPDPEGFAAAKVRPAAAFYFDDFGQFILPYDAVRQAPDPDTVLMEFLQSTYDAAADLGKWHRAALDCALRAGDPGAIPLARSRLAAVAHTPAERARAEADISEVALIEA